jgi:hypothetical protein
MPIGPAYPSLLARPSHTVIVGCSFTRPLCVHAPAGTDTATLQTALADLEHADSALVQASGLPRPLADGSLGGGPGYDLYLVDRVVPANWQAATGNANLDGWCATGRDEPRPIGWDRASAFTLIDRRAVQPAESGCVGKNLIARGYASAIRFGLDAAESADVREAAAAHLAEIVAPCATVSAELVDDFQTHPERALTRPSDGASPATAMAFHWFVDSALGAGAPGVLSTALLTVGPQRTPPSSFEWLDEPDLFDALRGVLSAQRPRRNVGDLLLDFAVARMFLGDRDDGTHLAGSGWAGSFGRVRFEWSIPWTSLPRRLAPLRPVDPTGSTYLWIDLTGAPAGARLALHAEWEPPVVFRWAVIRVKPDGSEASRVLVTAQDRSTLAERNIDGLDGLAAVAIVGTNVGDIGLAHPFDPAEAPFEPHGYVLSLAAAAP